MTPARSWAAYLIAILISLALNLNLRFAGELGFYDGDSRTNLFRYLLTDDPLGSARRWGASWGN